MSLINKMLRDLDERHAPSVDRAGLPPAVHVLPAAPERSWSPLVLIAIVATAGAGGLFYWFEVHEAPPIVAPAPPPPPPKVVLPPPPPPQVMAPVEAPPPEPASEQRREGTIEPRLSETLSEPPKPETPAPPVAAVVPAPAPVPRPDKAVRPEGQPVQKALPAKPVAPVRAEKAPEPVKPEPATKSPAPQLPAVSRPAAAVRDAEPPAPPSIDKRPRTPMANEAADTAYRKAMAAVRRGAVVEAVEGLRATLKLDSHHASARQALLSLLVEQQQWDEARVLLEEGLAADPAQTSWAMALARLQLEHGKLAEAVDTLSRHARHAEQNPDYLAFLALLLQKQKRGREAAERYRAALALKPSESRWWYGLGLVLDADQKPQEAREAFLKARETGNLAPELAAAVEQKLK